MFLFGLPRLIRTSTERSHAAFYVVCAHLLGNIIVILRTRSESIGCRILFEWLAICP